MAAHTSANTGLLLDDDDDAPVPIVAAAAPDPHGAPAAQQVLPGAGVLVHPVDAPADVLERAIEWATIPAPTLGLRALVLYVTGLNVGLSRRERDLRLQFCALYRAAYSTPPDDER